MYQQDLLVSQPPNVAENLSEFIDDELPLPSFQQVFGFTVVPPSVNRSHKRRFSGSEGMDPRALAKRLKLDDFEKGSKHDSGRWTAEEHRLFLEGVMLYGKDWKKMQPLIKTRSLVQIRTHAQKVFKKIGLRRFSTNDENIDERNSNGVSISVPNIVSSESKMQATNISQESNEKTAILTTADTSSSLEATITSGIKESEQQLNSRSTDLANNDFRNYDMEVTDEEFNLVVQHLKNLGEIRGEDLSDEGEDGSINEGKHSLHVGQNDISGENSYDPSNENVNNDVRKHMEKDGDESDDKSRAPYIADDDAHNQHLLQTLRQYLMPDNEIGDGFSSTDYF